VQNAEAEVYQGLTSTQHAVAALGGLQPAEPVGDDDTGALAGESEQFSTGAGGGPGHGGCLPQQTAWSGSGITRARPWQS
jgi:hypothetical protein